MYEWHKSKINIGGDPGAGHVRDGNIIVFEVFLRRTRTRRGTGMRVMMTDT